jgi:hypothetical protein
MKSSLLLAASIVASASVLTGCYSPQPTDEQLHGYQDLPKADWYTLSDSSSEVKSLPAPLRNAMVRQRQEVDSEMTAKGALSQETQKRIKDMNENCNAAFLTSADNILSNPTPDLNGQFESWDKRRVNDSMIYSQNLRALADEWSRFWLMERPGGTPYDTVNTSGRF